MIFESHAHYDDERFDSDREKLLSSMQEQGIETIVNEPKRPLLWQMRMISFTGP